MAGSGSILARGKNRWLVRVSLGFDEQGKRRYHTKTVHGSKATANAYLLKTLEKIGRGEPTQELHMTVAELLERWLETMRTGKKVRERTLNDYSDIVHKRIKPALGQVQVKKLTPLVVQEFYNELSARGLAASTVRNTHTVLHSAFKRARRWFGLETNPAADLDLPKANQRCKRASEQYISGKDAARFIECALKYPRGIPYVLGILTGLRPGEYLALQWEDVNLTGGWVRVSKTLYRPRGGSWRFEPTKTAKSNRAVGLPPKMIPILEEHRARQLEARERAGDAYDEHDFVFATDLGKPLDHNNLSKTMFKKIVREAGLPERLSPYALRHSFTTVSQENGQDVSITSKLLGHSTVRLTVDTYSHLTTSMMANGASLMDTLL